MAHVKDTDWAYAAGFVDGEGCIAITRSFIPKRDKFVYSVAVVVVNRDRNVLDWMRQLWNGWVVAGSDAGGLSRRAWSWRSPTGTLAEEFLTGIRPWLRIKSPHADNALAMIEVLRRSRYTLGPKTLPAEWLDLQEQHYWRQRELNHRGRLDFVPRAMHSPRKINRSKLGIT